MVSDYVKWFGPTMGRDVGLLNSWQQNLRTSHGMGVGTLFYHDRFGEMMSHAVGFWPRLGAIFEYVSMRATSCKPAGNRTWPGNPENFLDTMEVYGWKNRACMVFLS